MHLESRRFAHDGQEIKPGARVPYPSRLEQQRLLKIMTVVDEVNPDRWHAEVLFLGEALMTTGPFDNDGQAARAAEEGFIKRLREIFGG